MKKLILFTLCIAMYMNLSSQNQKDTITNSELKDNKVKVSFSESQDHILFSFTLDNLIDKGVDSFYNSEVFNPNMGVYLLYDIPFGESGISIAPGIGFTFSKTNLDKSTLYQDSLGTTFLPSKYDPLFLNSAQKVYNSSSFYTSWIEVPFELRFKTKPIKGRSRIKFAAGFRVGLRMASNSKINYSDATLEREVIQKQKVFTDVNPFRYGVTFRMGYGAFNVFGYYGLNQFIKDSKNYNNLDLRQYSLGIAITGL